MVFALATFLIGLIALLVWLRIFGFDQRARGILLAALLLLLAADLANSGLGFMIWGIPGGNSPDQIVLKIVVFAPILEEAAKTFGALNRHIRRERFTLVSLFGIYELILSKPISMLQATNWSDLLPAFPALAMHVLTATMYAYSLEHRWTAKFAICVLIHALFNGFVMASSYRRDFNLIMVGIFVLIVIITLATGPWFKRTSLDAP
jgi:uncharacterized membrane protein